MKKIIIILLLLCFLTACTAQQEPNKSSRQISDYYPFLKETTLIYKGVGNEFAGREVYFDFAAANKAQLRVDNGGTIMGELLELKNGELRKLKSKEEFYYWQHLEAKKGTSYEILLKEPLIEGTSWELDDGRKRYISGVNVKVETPQGQYEALEVTTKGSDAKLKQYYAPDVGLVLQQYKSNGTVIETKLQKIKQNSAVTNQVKFFYPDFKADKAKYVERQVEFQTNDSPEQKFTELLQQKPPQGLTPVISEQTKINKIEVNQNNNIVKVDFTEELVWDMNAGHSLEKLIIQSIVNTFGRYYQVDKVYLSLEGEAYQSGHIMITEGQYFTVDEEIIPYQE
ncbi:MAG: GerMN domain-containing protein [Bacillota bacterium]